MRQCRKHVRRIAALPRIHVAALPLRAINLRHCRAIENTLGVWRHVAALPRLIRRVRMCAEMQLSSSHNFTRRFWRLSRARASRGAKTRNIWAQWPQAFVTWILLWVGFPIKILAAMPWYVHVFVLILVALRVLRLSPS